MTETSVVTIATCSLLGERSARLYMRAIPSEQTVLGYYHDVCPAAAPS
jgi:hypothetical protein